MPLIPTVMRLVPTAVLAAVLAYGPALAQVPATDGKSQVTPTSPMSLQSQLGSIPLISPRAAVKAAMLRSVRLTQMEGRSTRGATHEVACPDTGCQIAVSLVVDNVSQAFLADVQFVSQGVYVSLQPRTAAIGGVMEFRQGRPGPVFLKGKATTAIEQQISFITAPATSLRRLETTADRNTLTSGNLYTRKRTPDMVLRVEVDAARER